MKKENVLRRSEEMRERERTKEKIGSMRGKELRKQRETVEGNKGGSILCLCVCLKV